MRAVETTDLNNTLPIDALQSVLADHPVRLAILFGSYATNQQHARSDIDIAVELTDVAPADPDYNQAFFSLSADISLTLKTDDVDVVDIHSLSPSFTRTVFKNGVLLYGEQERAEQLQEELVPDTSNEESPRERLDDALKRIDEHLA